jgi:hypothetical protein
LHDDNSSRVDAAARRAKIIKHDRDHCVHYQSRGFLKESVCVAAGSPGDLKIMDQPGIKGHLRACNLCPKQERQSLEHAEASVDDYKL